MPNIQYNRRAGDNPHALEQRAREIAKQEGSTSLVASTLAIIDAHRRSGRVIEIVGVELQRVLPGVFHIVYWRELQSVVADRQGYLDGHSGLVKPKHTLDHKHVNRLGWFALGCGIVLGLAMGFGLGPIIGP